MDLGGSGEPVRQRACETEAQGVSEWQPVLTGSWLNSHTGGREVFGNRRCFYLQGFVAHSWNSKSKQQAHAGGRKLFTQVPTVNFVFCFDPLKTEHLFILFILLRIYIAILVGLSVFFSSIRAVLQKHLVI